MRFLRYIYTKGDEIDTHKVVRDVMVENHSGTRDESNELLLKSLHNTITFRTLEENKVEGNFTVVR